MQPHATAWIQWFPLHMTWHFLVAGGLGWLVARRTRRPWLGWLCAAMSILVDLDHVVDYLTYYGWHHISWQDFVNGGYIRETGKVYLWAHAWEWVALLLVISRWLPRPAVGVALALGLAGHLAVDTIDHHEYLGKNVLTYRIAHHFNVSAILTPDIQRATWGNVLWPPTVPLASPPRQLPHTSHSPQRGSNAQL